MAHARAFSFLAGLAVSAGILASPAGAQPIPGDPKSHMDGVLSYPSMIQVRDALVASHPRSDGSVVSGREIVRDLLRDYDPGRPNEDVERHVAAVLRRYEIERHEERVYLANVAHLVWLEWRLHGSAGGPVLGAGGPRSGGAPGVRGVGSPTFRMGANPQWSVRGYAAVYVDRYLLGPLWQDANAFATPGTTRGSNYNFKHFKNAKRVLDRMVGFHPTLEWDHASAAARLVESAGDHFNHTYTDSAGVGWGLERYKALASLDGAEDQDLSEVYQRRVGGCGMISGVVAMMARALNIPAAEDRPIIHDGPAGTSPDSHDYAYFPTLARPWLHGDSVIRPGGMGLLADELFLTDTVVAWGTFASLWEISYGLHLLARDELEAARGIAFGANVNFKRSASQARSFYVDNGWLSTGVADEAYFDARYGHMSPVSTPISTTVTAVSMPTQRYPLLDEVAAHWPLDAIAGGRVEDAMLPRSDGYDSAGTLAASRSAVKGGALRFDGASHVVVEDRPVLRRNDEELSISVWIRPGRGEPGGRIFARETRRLASPVPLDASPLEDGDALDPLPTTLPPTLPGVAPYDFAYDLELTGDLRLRFVVQREGDGARFAVESPEPVRAGRWTHVVATFASPGRLRLYVDGREVGSAPAGGPLPMAYVAQNAFGTYVHVPYPSRITIGDGFRGDLDEVILYFGELQAKEVSSLRRRY